MKQSKLWTLKWFDLGKAAVVAGLTVVLPSLYNGLTASPPHFPTNLEMIGYLKLAGWTAAAYLIKQLMTSSSGEILKTEKSKNENS